MKEDFAFIIGINDYTPPEQRGLRPLYGAINDANAIEQWMLDLEGGAVKAENCFKITSTPEPLIPVQHNIDQKAVLLLDKVKSLGGGRRLYFYFAGHGLGDMNNTKNTALCLSPWSEILRNSALSSIQYEDTIIRFGLFEEVIFLLDCCRNTKINVQPMPPGFDSIAPSPRAGQTKVFIAHATQYQDQSFEVDLQTAPDTSIVDSNIKTDKRGIFTKVLLDALKGAAANENGVINADKLRDYLAYQTPREAKLYGYKQKPAIEHSFTSDIALFTIASPRERIRCNLRITDNRDKEITLYSNEGVFMVINPMLTRVFSLELLPGTYLLEEKETRNKKAFQVVANTAEQHVEF